MYKKYKLYQQGGVFTQDSGSQDFAKNKLQNFLSKIDENKMNFQTDEGLADAIAIQQAINKEIPEFKSGGNWMKNAKKEMKRKGTVGKFTEYCGGKVTNDCIERGLNSPDETVRKRAAFAKASRTIARNKAAFGGFLPMPENNLPMAEDGTEVEITDPGVKVDVNVKKVDPTLSAWEDYIGAMGKRGRDQFSKGFGTMAGAAYNLLSKPVKYEYKGDTKNLLSDYPDADFESMEITGYTPGMYNKNEGKTNIFGAPKKDKWKAGKTATLHLRATGSREPLRPAYANPYREDPYPTIDPSTDPFKDETPFEGSVDNSPFYYKNGGGMKKYRIKKYQGNYGSSEVPDDGAFEGMNLFEGEQKDPSFVWESPYVPKEEDYGTDGYSVTQDTDIELEKVSKWDQMKKEQPFLASNLMLAGLDTASGFLRGRETARQEEELAKRRRDVFRKYDVGERDRGDYTGFTTQKIGPNLTPTKYTRKGYGTKMAQMGYEVDQELELTPAEIQELINQGYDLEFLD